MSVGQRGLPCMTTLTFANSAINVSLCPIAYLMASSSRRICFVGMRHPHLRPAQQWHHSGATPTCALHNSAITVASFSHG